MSAPRVIALVIVVFALTGLWTGEAFFRAFFGKRGSAELPGDYHQRSRKHRPLEARGDAGLDVSHGVTEDSESRKRGPAKVGANDERTNDDHRWSGRNGAARRKPIVDAMAGWSEIPAWPEGPRLFASVETPSQRYVNLRPNDMGLLPELSVAQLERISIKLVFPDESEGETVYLELPNGGSFPNTEAVGRTLKIGQGRSVFFDIVCDDEPGECTLRVRQAGHSRTLPLRVVGATAVPMPHPASD